MSKTGNNLKLTIVLILGALLGSAVTYLMVSGEIEKINSQNTEHLKQLEYDHWKEITDTVHYSDNINRKVSAFYKFQSSYSNSYYKNRLTQTEDFNLVKLASQLVDAIEELREINLNEIGWNDLYVVKNPNSGSIDYLMFGDVFIIYSEELALQINNRPQLKEHIESL
jgi:hypothetical protein